MNSNNYTLSSSNYLLNCDSVSKYNLKSRFNQPQITEINFKLLFNEVVSATMSSNSNDKDNHLKIKSLLIIYILFSFFPKIISKKKKTGKKKNSFMLDDEEYFYNVKINQKKQMHPILSRILFETKFAIETLNNEKLSNITVQSNNVANLNTRVPVNQFYDVNEFFNSSSTDLSLNKIFIHTNFIYSKIPQGTQAVNIIKNNFFFV